MQKGKNREEGWRKIEARRCRNLTGRMRPMYWSLRGWAAKMMRHDTAVWPS
jgi:hypothetical protein